MDALRADSGDAIVLVTPAFPETGRTVYQGNLFVGSVPLNESPLKDHPLNPMHDSNLVRVLARQSRTKVGLVDLAMIARGPDAVRAHLAELVRTGFWRGDRRRRIRARPRNHRHGRARPSRLGWRIGASVLGLPARWWHRAAPRRARRRTFQDSPVGGPAACLAGSCSQATLSRSPSASRRCRCCISIPSRSSRARTRHSARWPGPRRGSQRPGADRQQFDARSGRGVAGAPRPRRCRHAIEQAMADIAEGLVDSGVRRLVVAGGETSGAVVDRLGIPAFWSAPKSPPACRCCGPSAPRTARCCWR